MPFIVYEVVNETLKELFVGATKSPLENLHDQHKKTPPPSISHWRFNEHRIKYREIEKEMPDADFRAFIDGYANANKKSGWKIITE